MDGKNKMGPKIESNVPRWNLDSLFASADCAEYKNAVQKYEDGIKILGQMIENAPNSLSNSPAQDGFCAWLKTFLLKFDEVTALSMTLNAYSYIVYSVETTNSSLLNNISKIDDISLALEKIDIEFNKILSENKEKISEFTEKYPEFAEFKFLLNERVECSAHQMESELENLAGDLQKTSSSAWERLQEQIISNLCDENGTTFNELRNNAYSPDKKVRKSSYEKEISLLQKYEIPVAASLNCIKGETLTLNKRRNWEKPLDRALFSSRMNEKTLGALISVMEKALPHWRKYFKAKGKFLRAKNLTESLDSGEGIAFYDLFAPVSVNENSSDDSILSKTWTFDEAKNYVCEKYREFSGDAGDFAENAFKNGWIDAEVRQGKVGGAYDEDFALGHQSRILTNFTGTFSDIITLAHELGHAYHFSTLKGKPAQFFSYPMTLAETASTFAETLVKTPLLEKCSEAEKLEILDLDLQDSSQVLVDILCRFYFESEVFARRKTSELTAADFNGIMEEAQEKSYGDGLNSERHKYMWAVKSHYYSADLDFYNFPYAFGQLFAAALYARYKSEGKKFAETYREILSFTGSLSCEELCRKAGFDIQSEEFWQSGMNIYIERIEEFCKLTEKFCN